jgi:hypothetical protein
MIVPPRIGPNGNMSTGLTAISPDRGALTAAMASGVAAIAVGPPAADVDGEGLGAGAGLAGVVVG